MSIIKGKYELSIWEDKLVEGEFIESKKCVIGSDKMQDVMVSHRAYDIALTRNVNGSKSLTFKLAYVYTDVQTGQKVSNPFVGMLANETKIKLHQIDKNKWYDFIIKNISEDTKSHTCTYQAEDQFVNELSKNGFGVILDREKQNNINTNTGLAKEVLKDTDWEVDEDNSDVNVQLQDEALYLIQIPTSLSVKRIFDPNNEKGTTIGDITLNASGKNNYALAFYSSCYGKPKRFQFIYVDGTNPENENSTSYEVDEDSNIINEDCQYYIDNPVYGNETAQGLYLPAEITFTGTVLKKYRAKRYVFSTETDYFTPLDIYVQKVEKGGKVYNYCTENTYEAPTFITNIVSNNSFTNTSGWTGNCFGSSKSTENAGDTYDAIVAAKTTPDAMETLESKGFTAETNFTPYLEISWPKDSNSNLVTGNFTPMAIESGFYDNRVNIDSFKNGDKFVFAWCLKDNKNLFDYVEKIEVANWDHDNNKSCYIRDDSKCYMTIQQEAGTVVSEDKTYHYAIGQVHNSNFTETQFKKSKVRTFFTLKQNKEPLEILDFQIFKCVVSEFGLLEWKNISSTLAGPTLVGGTPEYLNCTPNYKNGIFELSNIQSREEIVYHFVDTKSTNLYNLQAGKEYILSGKIEIYNLSDTERELSFLLSYYNNKDGWKSNSYKIYKYQNIDETDFSVYFKVPENATGCNLSFQIGKKNEELCQGTIKFKGLSLTTKCIFPWDQSTEGTIITKHYYFDPADDDNKKVEKIGDLKTLVSTDVVDTTFKPVIDNKCTKRREVSAKESNYFNILQSIAEKFECWLKIELTRDDNGAVTEKKVLFKNYIGNNKRPGFRYGLNLKSIQRTNDSKAITTKLIVKTNSNELAKNGFCTIARAKANPTGETGLYDFSYYFNQGLLSKEDFLDEVNSIPSTTKISSLTYDNTQYYYYKLRQLNQELLEKNNRLIEILPQKIDVQANLQIAEEGVTSTQEIYLEALEDFEELAKFSLDGGALSAEQVEQIESNSDLLKYFTKAREALAMKNTHEKNKTTLTTQLAQIISEQNSLEADIATLTTNKSNLNKAFYKKYARFIQEGTWIGEEYIDDEKYYLDAQTTLYNSCWPQVSYSITVANLENHEDYKGYTYDIGDQTYIQDPEFFGYEKDGITPYRKDVVISEKTEYIDNPQKDTIKVQTFKNQFQDLFKAITATVQQVQYSTGAYQRAAELAVSDDRDRYKFLQGALNSTEMAIQNAGDQTVIWDSRGITITDSLNNAKQLRLVSGAIMFRTLDEKGDEVWKTGITPEGISADLITAGRLDAGLIQIMDKNHPSFRWDARGLTAYLETNKGYDTASGVRFNSKGLFGFNNIKNAYTCEINEENATFYLSQEGIKVQPPNFGSDTNKIYTKDYAAIGKVDEKIYKGWSNGGLPIEVDSDEKYDEETVKFVKIMEVGSDDGILKKGSLTIYSDGTITAKKLLVTDGVGYAAAASPNQIVYHQGIGGAVPAKPVDGKLYNTFDKTGYDWHKEKGADDKYSSKTTDGGYTWSEVYSIGLDFTINSDTAFFVFNEDKKPAFDQTAILVIQGEIPTEERVTWKVNGNPISGTGKTQQYQVLANTTYETNEFIVSAEIDGTKREIKILVTTQKVGKDAVNCYIESSVGFLIEQSETTQIATLTAKIYQGTEEIDPNGTELVYTWYIDGTAQTGDGTSGKTLKVQVGNIKDKTVYFTAEEKTQKTAEQS